jgi:hypothetical protein
VRKIPRAPLVGLVLLGVAVALAVLVLGQGGATPAAAQPADPHYKCYDIVGDAPAVPPVELETQFGVEPAVTVGTPAKVCLPAGKNGAPIPPDWPVLKCYTIAGMDPPYEVMLETQFGIENDVDVGPASLLCIPAAMTVGGSPAPTPPPPDRHWECFDIVGSDPPDVVSLETEFGVEPSVAVGQATKLCAPALKNGDGNLNPNVVPHLKCYTITGSAPAVDPVNLTTQFGIEPGLIVGPPSMLCAPAMKTVTGPKVGGVAELPASAGGDEVAASTGGSGWSSANYAALAGGLAAAAVVIGAGGWYARRRWLR